MSFRKCVLLVRKFVYVRGGGEDKHTLRLFDTGLRLSQQRVCAQGDFLKLEKKTMSRGRKSASLFLCFNNRTGN